MPQVEDIAAHLPLVESLLLGNPVVTLKLQGLLATPDNITAIHLDDLDNPGAVLIAHGAFHSFYAESATSADALLDTIDWSSPIAFSGVWEPLLAKIASRAPVGWRTACHQYHLPEGSSTMDDLFAARGDDAHLMEPTPDHVDLILTHWPHGSADADADRDHILERIASGLTAGWVQDAKLVCWAFTHPDGSLGYLHTLPDYRGRGIAKRVIADLALKVWNKGLVPFGHVVEDSHNPAPMLAELGFERYGSTFVWCGVG